MLTNTFRIHQTSGQTGTVVFSNIHIEADGTVDPANAPIRQNGSVYILTDDLMFNDSSGGLIVEKDNIVLNGGGHALELYNNPDDGVGITVSQGSNITITGISSRTVSLNQSTNCTIMNSSILLGFTDDWSVNLSSSNNNSILGNVMATMMFENSSNNYMAGNILNGGTIIRYGPTIVLSDSFNNTICENSISLSLDMNSPPSPLFNLSSSSENTIYHNSISFPYSWYRTYDPGGPIIVVQADNSTNNWDNGYPSGGNYWNGYQFNDSYSGPYQNITGSDGIADTPYLLASNNYDNYPLMNPVQVSFEDIEIVDVGPKVTLIPADTQVEFEIAAENNGGCASTWNLTFTAEYTYTPVERSFCLQADAAKGWNQTISGPTISVIQGDAVNLTLISADDLHHQFFVDYNNDSFAEGEDPVSQSFINNTVVLSFTASTIGNFTYYDAYHENTMLGSFIVNPEPSQLAQMDINNVQLDSNQSVTLKASWNTTGYLYGQYIISAYAKPSLRETHITDNILSGGIVKVTLPGDLNGDYQVTSLDVTILAEAYGSEPGSANWNSNADLDNNKIVGLSDLVTLALHYGEQYPWPVGPPPPASPPPPL